MLVVGENSAITFIDPFRGITLEFLHATLGKSKAAPKAPMSFVRIRITSHPGKYATRGVKGDLLVAPKAQASEFPSTEAPRRQKELERRGFKTKVEPA
jgi:hypothetical protein